MSVCECLCHETSLAIVAGKEIDLRYPNGDCDVECCLPWAIGRAERAEAEVSRLRDLYEAPGSWGERMKVEIGRTAVQIRASALEDAAGIAEGVDHDPGTGSCCIDLANEIAATIRAEAAKLTKEVGDAQ